MWHDLTEPFGQSPALCLIGPRGGVSEPGEEDRCNTRDPAKPHRDHQVPHGMVPAMGHPSAVRANCKTAIAAKTNRHNQGVTLRVHDLLALNSRVPGVPNSWLPFVIQSAPSRCSGYPCRQACQAPEQAPPGPWPRQVPVP